MSAAHSDKELLRQIRLRAFEGAVITAMLSQEPLGPAGVALKPLLTEHFAAVLRAIDGKTVWSDLNADYTDDELVALVRAVLVRISGAEDGSAAHS